MTPTARLAELGGSGPDTLLIHGFGSDRLCWTANVPGLSAKTSLWAVDLPGHGKAQDAVGDGSAATMAAAVARTLDTHGLTPTITVGHSFGGAIALHLARLRPVGRMVLIAPLGGESTINTTFLDAFTTATDAGELHRILQSLVVNPQLIQPQMAECVLEGLTESRRRSLATIAAAMDGMKVPPLDWARILWGAKDRINPLSKTSVRTGNHDLHIIPETGHMPFMEAASTTNRLVLELLPAT